MIAIPSEPPTWRMLFKTADPTPALSTGTDPMAAAVVGVIANDMPTPPTSSAGRRPQKFVFVSNRESSNSDTERKPIPVPISHREPIWSESLPAIGASSTIRIVIGRKMAPACVGE